MEKQVVYCIKSLDNAIFRKMFESLKDIQYRAFSPIQGEIVKILINSKDKNIYQKDLEKLIGIRRSTISGILKTMEKNNVISRVDSIDDKRVKEIILTDKAKKIHLDISVKLKQMNKDITKGISEEELDNFFMVVEKIKKNLEG